MKDENLAVPLNPRTAEFLAKLVKVAVETESTTLRIDSCQSARYRGGDYTVSNTRGRDLEDTEPVSEAVEGIPDNPLLELEVRGYLLGHEGPRWVLNYQLAQQRVKYETKGKMGKRWMRATNDWGRFVLDLAAAVAGLWAIADMIRMLVEALS